MKQNQWLIPRFAIHANQGRKIKKKGKEDKIKKSKILKY